MRSLTTRLLIAALIASPIVGAMAGPDKSEKRRKRAKKKKQISPELQARKDAVSFIRTRINGEELADRAAKLGKLTWHADLSEAYAAARKANKPILWFHALGSLEGDL